MTIWIGGLWDSPRPYITKWVGCSGSLVTRSADKYSRCSMGAELLRCAWPLLKVTGIWNDSRERNPVLDMYNVDCSVIPSHGVCRWTRSRMWQGIKVRQFSLQHSNSDTSVKWDHSPQSPHHRHVARRHRLLQQRGETKIAGMLSITKPCIAGSNTTFISKKHHWLLHFYTVYVSMLHDGTLTRSQLPITLWHSWNIPRTHSCSYAKKEMQEKINVEQGKGNKK